MKLPEDIHELILEDLASKLDVLGQEKLEAWLEENGENRETYRKFCSLWYSGKWANSRVVIKKQVAWEQIQGRRRNRRRIRWVVRSTSVAASLICVIGLIWLFTSKDESILVASLPKWQPRQATLVLSTGETKELSVAKMSMIEEKGAIICSDSAYLEYRNEGLEKSQEEQVYNELIVPKGGEYRLRLVDGSLVVINSGSRLRFPVSFNGKSREVFLSGGACFEVAKDSLKPFIVHANEADVRVLGTLFDVSAYEDEERVEVTLVNGAVKIAVDGSNARLVPNEQFVFNRRTGETLVREVDAESYIAWTNGIFRFDALPLDLLMKKLSRWFDIQYEFEDDVLKEVLYSGGFRKYDNIQDILNMIGEVTNISFIVTNDVIKINKKSDNATNITR